MNDREVMQMVLEALEPSMSFAPRKIKEAINALRARLAQPEPLPPPPECKTVAEKNAYAFGWWKALETVRLAQPDLARVGEVGVWGEPVACECHRCIKEKDLRSNGGLPLSMGKMILCPKCGNKRCPKASDHRLDCTGSNEPGQPGSVYTHPPVAESNTSQKRVDETQEQRHEPVAMRWDFNGDGYWYMDASNGSNWQTRVKGAEPLYTHPPKQEPVIDKSAAKRICTQLGWEPKREWQKLTDEEIQAILDKPEPYYNTMFWFARAIERRLKEKNHG